jgi:competence protein ComEA
MLLLLLGLAVAGQGVRYVATRPGESPGGVQILSTLAPGSPAAQRDSATQYRRPLTAGERINVDTAPAVELARLPRVGLRLAKTMVADRAEHGPFGSLVGLDRVAGVGPGLLKILAPHVSFSGAGPQEIAAASAGRQPESPAADPSCPKAGAPPSSCRAAPLDINSASAQELDALPGIGPARARAIVRYRQEHGPFTGPESLLQVPGMARSAVNRLADRIYVR